MNLGEYLVNKLIQYGVTDIFGIPGGVVLDFLYSLKNRLNEIQAHLLFNEQDAAYAALGFAQANNQLGVAFATRGPGVLNMVTTVTDAYHDSVPLLIITAHSSFDRFSDIRILDNQEIDTKKVFRCISKEVIHVDVLDEAVNCICRACSAAVENRQGPVILDVHTKLWNAQLPEIKEVKKDNYGIYKQDINLAEIECEITNALSEATRPVLLIGDGIRQAHMERDIRCFAELNCIPVLSSRGAQDIMPDSPMYFGYIGSHGIRYANFILSKTDCIISIGNRLAFPVQSKSFASIFQRSKLLRLDIDGREFQRIINNSNNYVVDVSRLKLFFSTKHCSLKNDWIRVCTILRNKLNEFDLDEPVSSLVKLIKLTSFCEVLVSDVGNNEYWLSRAYEYIKVPKKILYSRSLGALGCSLGKAIGAYYRCRKPIICFCGDQGLQYNLSELQYISHNQLPISIVVINNRSSGMIKTRQNIKYGGEYYLTTEGSGYSVADFKKIAEAYNIAYECIKTEDDLNEMTSLSNKKPHIIELIVPEEADLTISLPVGRACQDMEPRIEKELYNTLCSL
jgi:acetolactate synthase-1/2/3 large subunit